MPSRLSTLDKEVPLLTGKMTLLHEWTLGKFKYGGPHTTEQVEDVKVF